MRITASELRANIYRLLDQVAETGEANAALLTWTCDPFDRVIVGNALADAADLLTADTVVREHYERACWD